MHSVGAASLILCWVAIPQGQSAFCPAPYHSMCEIRWPQSVTHTDVQNIYDLVPSSGLHQEGIVTPGTRKLDRHDKYACESLLSAGNAQRCTRCGTTLQLLPCLTSSPANNVGVGKPGVKANLHVKTVRPDIKSHPVNLCLFDL